MPKKFEFCKITKGPKYMTYPSNINKAKGKNK